MPTIQTYQSSIKERSKQAPFETLDIPDQGVEARALGELGRTIGGVGREILDAEIQESRKFDRTAALEALNIAMTQDGEYLQENVYARKGKSANNVYDESKQYFEQRTRELEKGLQNNRQRRMFSEAYSNYVVRDLGNIRGYQSQQLDNWNKAELKSREQNLIDDAVRNRYSAKDITENREDLKNAVRAQWSDYGEETVKNETAEALNDFHSNIIAGYIGDRDLETAEKYINNKNVKMELDSKTRANFMEHIKSAQTQELAQENVDRIMADYEDPQERREQLKTLDPEVRNMARPLLDYWQNKERTDEYDSALNAIQNMKAKGLPRQNAMITAGTVKNPTDRQSLKRITNDLYSKGEVTSDPEAIYELALMNDPELIKVDFRRYVGRLSPPEFTSWRNKQKAASKRMADQSGVVVRTPLAQANDALESVGLFEDKKDEEKQGRRREFFSDFEDELAVVEKDKGRKPTPAETEEVINKLLMQFSEKGWLFEEAIFGNKYFAFEINTEKEQKNVGLYDDKGRIKVNVPVRPEGAGKDAEWDWNRMAWIKKGPQGQTLVWRD
jgi:hypothetical protein